MKSKMLGVIGLSTALLLLTACSGGEDSPGGDPGPLNEETSNSSTELPASIRSAGRITFGAELTVPPMTFFESDGKTQTGVNHDLGEAIGERLGIGVQFDQYAFPGLQPALKSGKIDAIFDVINDTQEREKQFDFIDYVKAGDALLLADGNPHNIRDLSDMCGLSASTVAGAVQTEVLRKASDECTGSGKEPITIQDFPSAQDARLQIQSGKYDAFIGNAPVLLYLAKTAENGSAFDAIAIDGPPSYFGIALTKDNAQLRDAIMAALGELIEDGTYGSILDKYDLGALGVDKPLLNEAVS